MISRILLLLLLLAATGKISVAEDRCGDGEVCHVENGDYRIELPPRSTPRGVFVFFHGYKSSAELQMKQRKIVDTVLAHDLAFVAVDGIDGSWSFIDSPRSDRNEKVFIAAVFADLHRRFGFTPEDTVIGGFSIGASMAWYTACQQGEKVRAMLTFSGVFWDPLPAPSDCVRDIPFIVHFHGTADRTFPLAGRPIGTHFHQGDAFKSMAIVRERANCKLKRGVKIKLAGIDCDEIPDCFRGPSIMCVHRGGHEVYPAMLDAGLTAVGFGK